MITQQEIILPAFSRGLHLITNFVIDEIQLPETGLFHLFIKHTSAALSINENADPTVRQDMEMWFDKHVKENESYYKHVFEGSDDMPAHIKASLIGCSITIPISNGRFNLGTWQGIYLCEFRNHGGSRKLVATVYQ